MVNCKVSVVIPFYNNGVEVLRAVRSVLFQSYKNIELIVIDDGSTENVDEIYNFCSSFNNVKIIKNKRNLGASAARNKGILASTGEYIAFLDSDDEFLPDKVRWQLCTMLKSGAKISHTSYKREMGGNDDVVLSGMQRGKCAREMIYRCLIATPTVMIEREWLLERGALFPVEAKFGEDTCFWLELMKGGTDLYGIEEPLTTVHTSDESAAYNPSKQMIGLKTIIRYVINDEYYGQFNYELSKIMEYFVRHTRKALGGSESFNEKLYKKIKRRIIGR